MSPFGKSLLVLCLAVVVFSTALPATAADARPVHCKGVTVSSGVLHIDAVLSDPESFKGVLRVKATRKGRKPYFLPSGDLVSNGRSIPAGRVEIANLGETLPYDKKKGKGRWRSISVTVKDARFAGEYSGGLELGSGGCKVEFFLDVSGGAEISLVGTGEKAVKLKLSSCRYSTCGPDDFFQWLNSSTARSDSVEVQVDNAAQGPADVTEVQVALNSDVGEEIVPEEAFTPTPRRFQLPAQHVSTLLPISIDRGKIDAGHYTGAIYLTVEGAEKRVVLPFELDVKDGAFWALVVLLAALLVQLCVAFANLARSRHSASRKVKKVRKKAKAKLGADAALLQPRLDQATELVRSGQLSEAERESAQIEEEIERIRTAQELEDDARSDQGELPADFVQVAGEFQAAVKQGDDSAGPLDELEKKVEPKRGGKSRISTAVLWFGVYVLPWLIRVVLVVAFLLAGLEKLYFSNATFGAQEFVDYGGLFLWGLTAAAFNTVLGKIVPEAGKG